MMRSKFQIVFLLFLILLLIPNNQGYATGANFSVSAEAAILLDRDSGRILYAKNIDQPMRIASITKIMTAIIAIEQGDLQAKVITSDNAFGMEGSSIFLRRGETLSLEDMLYGLMLRSGNDAAVAIAEHIGGSVEGFALLMNQKAAELGMLNTWFSNPHGLDHQEEHFSTARDMALLSAYAMQNEAFAQIVGTKRKTAPLEGEKWDRVWYNKNRLLTMYPFADGIKTGFTKRARRTLVSSATKEGHSLIAVTLNASDDWNDHIHMFEYGFSQFTKVTLTKEKVLTDERLKRGDGQFQVVRSFAYPLMETEKVKQKIFLHPFFQAEQLPEKEVPYPAGYLIFQLDQQEIGKIPLRFIPKNSRGTFWHSWQQVLKQLVGGTV